MKKDKQTIAFMNFNRKHHAFIHSLRGFTLVEMAIAMVVSSILVVGISIIVTSSHKYIDAGRAKKRLQQDYSLLEQVLARKIRNSIQSKQKVYKNYSAYVSGSQPQKAGACLKLRYPSGDSVVIYKAGPDFVIQDTNLLTTNLINGKIDSLTFSDFSKSIHTYVSLKNGATVIADTLVDAFRNFAILQQDWLYALFADKKLDVTLGPATVTGNVQYNKTFSDVNNYLQINGQLTKTPKVKKPKIDLKFFKKEAQNSGQYDPNSVKYFDAISGPYSGVWYVEGDAVLYQNTVINGTIAAKKNIIFLGANITATATPNNYPVLVSGGEFRCSYNNHTIKGLILSKKKAIFNGDTINITGAVISEKDVFLSASNITINYDGSYLTNTVGISFSNKEEDD